MSIGGDWRGKLYRKQSSSLGLNAMIGPLFPAVVEQGLEMERTKDDDVTTRHCQNYSLRWYR